MTRSRSTSFGLLTFAACLHVVFVAPVMTSSAHAATLAMNFDNTGNLNGVTTTDRTIGWAFSLTQPVAVTGLGYWDVSPADDLGNSHDVAIWSASGGGTIGDALVTGTVAINDAFAAGSQFRFVTVTSTVLPVGDYVIGAFLLAGSQDYMRTNANNEVFAPQVSFDQSALLTSNSTFQRPTLDGLPGGRYGPNFQFDEVTTGAIAIPEPSTLALLGLGLASMAVKRRRRAGR